MIGGGITGLVAACRLRELDSTINVVLYEAADRLGGILQTENGDGYLIERAADMFTTREPWARELCERIGFADQLIPTNSGYRGAYVVHRGRLQRVPQGFVLMRPTEIGPTLTTPLLSWRGKLRLLAEPLVRRRTDPADESLASFATRRLGREAYTNLIQPLIGGIYTADPERLSMQATMEQFVAMEREHGSLIRATWRQREGGKSTVRETGARYSTFVAPRDGMASLIQHLASRLPEGTIRLNRSVRELAPAEGNLWRVRSAGPPDANGSTPADASDELFDGVIVATPAPAAAKLLGPIDAVLASDLGRIPYAGVTVAVLVLNKSDVPHALDAFGYVTPQAEHRKVLAVSFGSLKFAGRAPDDQVIMRVFIGGALQSELADLPDEQIKAITREELRELMGVVTEPLLWKIVRWKGAMPQYHVGHLQLVEKIEAAAERWPNLELAGNAYRGVGIPYCVRSAEEAAARLLKVSQPTDSEP